MNDVTIDEAGVSEDDLRADRDALSRQMDVLIQKRAALALMLRDDLVDFKRDLMAAFNSVFSHRERRLETRLVNRVTALLEARDRRSE